MKNEISLSPFPGDTSPPNTSREPCGERNVVGAVGRAVTLRVTYTGTRSIIWSFDEKSDNLATTRPGGSLDILDPQYDGRLSGSSDGSLIITNLQHEDQGTYRARIIKNVSQYCVYHLYVINVRSQEPCGERNVTGAVGGAVTLHVTHTGTRTITWTFVDKGDTIAITKPGRSPEIQDKRYEGRLSSSSDGFLTITNLQHEDQGTYRAQSRNLDCSYHLSVINVKSQEPCGERNVSGAVGGAITLHVTHTGDGKMFWIFGERDIIASRKPGVPLEIEDKEYRGRLSGSSDGSLTITNLQHEDQGTYRTRIQNVNQNCYHLSVFRNLTAEDITISSNVTYNTTCEVILTCSMNSAKKSNVTVTWRRGNSGDIFPPTENVVLVPPSHIHLTYICTATNPVSNASKSVLPGKYCERGGITSKADYTMVNVIRLGISGCVLLITCCIFIHHMKTEVITQRPGTDST